MRAAELVPKQTCAACAHRTRHNSCAEPVAAGLADRFSVVWLSLIGNHATTCPAHTPRVQPPMADGVPRLTVNELRHATSWNDAEVAQAMSYVQQAEWHGLDLDMADLVADRLILRDRQRDDRRMCLECGHLNPRGRCDAAATGRLPGAGRDHRPVKVTLFRCPAFTKART